MYKFMIQTVFLHVYISREQIMAYYGCAMYLVLGFETLGFK